MTPQPVLEIRELAARAGGATLLDDVDLTLAAGEVLAVVGTSGAGKSTLGLAVLGEAAAGVALTGSVRVAGAEMLHGPRHQHGGRVGHLPQHPGSVLDPVRRCGRVLDELAALIHPDDRPARDGAVARALELARLDPALGSRFPHQLSGGQQQRMALAQTIVTGPAVVVLDVPTTGLDPETANQLTERLAALAATGTAIVLLTHDRRIARALAHGVVVLDAGRVVRRGDAASVLGPGEEVTAPERTAAGAERLVVEGLTVRAAGGRVLLDGFGLRAAAGEWVAVHGRSGAGKTTLARAVAGLIAPRAGSVTVDGTRLAAAVADRPAAQRRLVQYVHQDASSSFLPDRPVLGQVARGAVLLRALDPPDATAEAVALLARLGVGEETARRRPGALSGGQLQRAAVARALLVRPAVLVTDEMTSALDPEHRAGVLAAVDEDRRARGTTVVSVTHDVEASARVAHRVVEISSPGAPTPTPTPAPTPGPTDGHLSI